MEEYMRNFERLVQMQRDDQQQFHRTLEVVMSQVTQLTQLLEVRDREIVELRGRPPVQQVNPERENRTRIPISEVAQQIPQFSYQDDTTLTLESWLRKIDNAKTAYNLSDDVARMLATNKFSGVVKSWYDTQENFWTLTWPELIVKLKEMFGETKDIAGAMEKMRMRKWKKGERLEDYYMEKLRLARRAEVAEEEIIQHVIRGIDNFTVRVQLASGQYETLNGLFKAIRGISSSIEVYRENFHEDGNKVKVKCGICQREGHDSERCFRRIKTESFKDADYKQTQSGNGRTLICFRCQEPGHIAKLCTANISITPSNTSGPKSASIMQVDTLMTPVSSRMYYKNILSGDSTLVSLLDTGCPLNLIKQCCLSRKEIQRVYSEAKVLRGFGNQLVNGTSVVVFKGTIDSQVYIIPAAVVPDEAMAVDVILGQAFLDSVSWRKTENSIVFDSENELSEHVVSIMNIDIDPPEPTIDINPDLSTEQQSWILRTITKCVNNRNTDPSRCPVKLKIQLRHDRFVRARPRRFSYHEEQVIQNIVQDWLSRGIIRGSSSEYASPVTLAKKKMENTDFVSIIGK